MGAEGKDGLLQGHMSLGTLPGEEVALQRLLLAESNECLLAFTDGVLALVGC